VGSVENPQVFVVDGKIAKLRDITLGGISGLNVEVLSGLTTEDTVVVNGQYNLRDNVEVAIVKQGDRP
ncbi:MAG: efflux transporter periplasmic adaptor subunit, partial [candidate division Zixibacteria bacterium]|nr:efflux transporter periplasmic adaptor subunit [candidate division Zixibacteria bacterium]